MCLLSTWLLSVHGHYRECFLRRKLHLISLLIVGHDHYWHWFSNLKHVLTVSQLSSLEDIC